MYNSIPGEVGVEEHDVDLETSHREGTLDPLDEIPADFLQEKKLDIGDLAAVTARELQLVFRGRAPAVRLRRTWASTPILVGLTAILRRGPGSTAGMAVLTTAVTAEFLFPIASGRLTTTRAELVPSTTPVLAIVGAAALLSRVATVATASSFRCSVLVVSGFTSFSAVPAFTSLLPLDLGDFEV